MRYDLEQLGPTRFQDMSAALAVSVFGPGVQSMGAGRDGGRDMCYRGRLTWVDGSGEAAETWDGYTIFQVKHKRTLSARPEDNATWLWSQVRGELDAWAEPGSDRAEIPDHLVFVTNVPLSPTPGTGGYDVLHTHIARYIARLEDDSRDIPGEAGSVRRAKLARLSRIKKWRFWDANQIQALLDGRPGVRNAFSAFLTAADVFANLSQFTDKLPLDALGPALRTHARSSLTGEGTIHFDEAGSHGMPGLPLHEVVVDLPVTTVDGSSRDSVIRYVLDRAERMLKPGVTTWTGPRHLVLTGAPGNGKTTLSRFLVQAFRAAMLRGSQDLSTDQRLLIDGTKQSLQRVGRQLPRHRRWAMRVDLAEYAQEGGLDSDSTLLRWISRKISQRLDAGEASPAVLSSWMKQWPWFLVLDGLDEVTEPSLRRRLIQQVTEFVDEAEAEDCDVLTILTTRLVGYTEHIAPTHFERIDLDHLSLEEAVRYGTLAVQARLRDDVDRVDKVVRGLRDAAGDEALQGLLRTPLQVLILTIIIDGAGHLAPDRYSLFRNYYDTVFKREQSKIGGLHHLLQEYGQQIQQLHEHVGFELQARSESGDRSYATLSRNELRAIAWRILEEDGFEPGGRDSGLLDGILDAATHRLVLIVPRGDEGYGFDVRSLQELTAAMRLTTGPLDVVCARLRFAAASPHWRNTWIFAAGRLFSEPQPHQHRAVVELVEALDDDAPGRCGAAVPLGPRLALEIVDDGMARSLPRWRSRLILRGLRVLHEPVSDDLLSIARVLVRYADTGEEQAKEVANGIRGALREGGEARATSIAARNFIALVAEKTGAGVDARAVSHILEQPTLQAQGRAPHGWEDFDLEFATASLNGSLQILAADAQAAIYHLANGQIDIGEATGDVLAALADEHTAVVLSAALSHVTPHEPRLALALRTTVLTEIYRQPLGDALRP